MKIITPMLVALLITGCFHDDDKVEIIEPIEELNFSVSYFNKEIEKLDDTLIPEDIKLIFPIIPGNLFGFVSAENLFELEYNENDEYTLELTTDVFSVETGPSVTSQDALDNGFKTIPENTMFGRLGTFAVTVDDEPIASNGYGFYDNKYKHTFLIAYFDQKSNISTQYTTDGFNIKIDINVPEAGYYAIKSSKPGDIHSKDISISAYNPSNDLVFIMLIKPEGNFSKTNDSIAMSEYIQSLCKDIICDVAR